ncbi:MAG: hypothetical protein GF375_06610 [Candidatus Omnitrophica bacterium]|nr:hypothetical protein [Candidatus Omnitrophota bacterium]MBD3269645.1 hypothetical protein [Candidatus Omnitrophota bacterium]
MLVDSHCHLNSLSPDTLRRVISSPDRDCIFFDSSIDFDSSLASIELSRRYDFIYTALGFHPFKVKDFRDSVIDDYRKLIRENKKIIAIGEIGLDYKADSEAALQEEVFIKFLELAGFENLPVILHNRFQNKKSSTCRALEIIEDVFAVYDKVVFHCFSYSPALMDEIIKRGGMVSFSLNVLREDKGIIASLERCPVENLLLETDSPYMKIKGSASTPLDIKNVYSFASSCKRIGEDYLKEAVFSNVRRVFSV